MKQRRKKRVTDKHKDRHRETGRQTETRAVCLSLRRFQFVRCLFVIRSVIKLLFLCNGISHPSSPMPWDHVPLCPRLSVRPYVCLSVCLSLCLSVSFASFFIQTPRSY